jgi:hypothetical protein
VATKAKLPKRLTTKQAQKELIRTLHLICEQEAYLADLRNIASGFAREAGEVPPYPTLMDFGRPLNDLGEGI